MKGVPALDRLLRSRRGSAAIEFALVVPVLLALAAGIVEIGLIFKIYNGANRLATQYAIAWSDCTDTPPGTCLTELSSYSSSNTVSNLVPQLVPANVTLQMFQVLMSGTTPVVTYSYPGSASLNSAQTAAAQAAFSSGQKGVVVTASYQHSLNFFSTFMTPFLGSRLNPSYTVTQLKS